MRARGRPCSAPLRQAGGIPAAAERGIPAAETPRASTRVPSPAGRGESWRQTLRRPPSPLPQRTFGRRWGTSSGSPGESRDAVEGESSAPAESPRAGRPDTRDTRRRSPAGGRRGDTGNPHRRPAAAFSLRGSRGSPGGWRGGGTGCTGWEVAARGRVGVPAGGRAGGRAVPAAPHSTPCAEEAGRGRGRGPTTMGLAGAINTRPRLYLVWPDHNRGRGGDGGVSKNSAARPPAPPPPPPLNGLRLRPLPRAIPIALHGARRLNLATPLASMTRLPCVSPLRPAPRNGARRVLCVDWPRRHEDGVPR